ncbi:hypothetical protein GCM10020000_00010 [Streptomyces olivoverticillatus]
MVVWRLRTTPWASRPGRVSGRSSAEHGSVALVAREAGEWIEVPYVTRAWLAQRRDQHPENHMAYEGRAPGTCVTGRAMKAGVVPPVARASGQSLANRFPR